MKYTDRMFSFLTATVLLLTLCAQTSCKSGNESVDSETAGTSGTEEITETVPEVAYDWTKLALSDKGTGGERRGEAYSYNKVSDFYEPEEYDKTKSGVHYLYYGFELTGLKDKNIQDSINAVISERCDAELKSVEWVESALADEAYTGNFPEGADIVAQSYVNSAVTVMGSALSVDILYIRSLTAFTEDKTLVGEEQVDEGRILYNFDLRDGRVIELSSLFANDCDYIKLVCKQMNKVAQIEGYNLKSRINGLPDDYDVFCLSESSLVVGLTADNPFTEEMNWFAFDISDFTEELAMDFNSTSDYFDAEVASVRTAFSCPGIEVTKESYENPLSKEKAEFPLISGSGNDSKINDDLKLWYSELTSNIYFADTDISKGGSYSTEIQIPARLINVTVFIYISSEQEYITLARCYNSETGEKVRLGELLTIEARQKYDTALLATENFRVGYDFVVNIPEQEDIANYVITDADEFELNYFNK